MVPYFKSIRHFITARRACMLFRNRVRTCPEVSDKYRNVYYWTLDNGINKC